MLPRRFALIRHVDYTGGAGTGVIAYGVAFDDGQVVLRWSSAHRATSVLDSVEDLVAAHGHGETTSIEWIDAAPGKSDAPAPAGRRARRPTPPTDEPSADAAQMPEPPATAPAEPVDARPAPRAPEPEAPAHLRPAAQATPAPSDAGHTTAPVPPAAAGATSAHPAAEAAQPAAPATPAQPTTSVRPATPAQPAVPEPPAQPAPEPPAAPARPQHASPAPEQPAANTPSWESAQSADDSSTQPNVAASLGVSRLAPRASSGHEPAQAAPPPAAPRPAAHTSPAPNGAAHPAESPYSGAAPSPNDERRARHEAIATQPMSADFSDEPEPRRPRRAGPPTHESPRSIFDEAEASPRPDLRLASSNGRTHEPDDADDPGNDEPARNEFSGFFSTGHQHLETVTGLLDLPAGLDKRGRGAEAEQDPLASRRNGKHRGE